MFLPSHHNVFFCVSFFAIYLHVSVFFRTFAVNKSNQNMRRLLIIILFIAAILCSCSEKRARYVIGVSQCSEDIWRDKQNAELLMGAYCHEDVELRFAAAYDSDERQVQQIDSLVKTGINLLIVAPNQVQTISPAIDRAYDSGIPVIVFERKTDSRKYTAFISADNYEMGRQMGEYVATRLHGKGKVLEVMGLKGSSPAIERHKGFTDALKRFPDVTMAATLQGDWTEESAYEATKQWLTENPDTPIDFVFGQNDRMAMGARKALSTHPTKYCGIDGLPGENGGIRLVRDSILDASYIYPTHGDRLIQLAIDILDGKPYEKETLLMSAIVTHDNANVLLMQSEETTRQTAYLDQLHQQSDKYLQQLDTQRTITILACAFIVLLLVAIVLLYLYHLSKVKLQQQRVVNTLWNMEAPPQPLPEKREADASAIDEQKEEQPSPLPQRETQEEEPEESASVPAFITHFKEAVEARLSDSDISVEDLAADMNMSRVQLYRKVKAITGSSPVELLRTARLNRGYQLLLTTDKSISEVAYEVGFSAPSYFTKCFKEEYGMLPGDVKNT
jgi:ABC-type sugar transport system substrate-binding protein/AraC-like DNA-binding protein